MIYRLAAQDREVTPDEEDWIDDYKREAYEFHNLLLQMGGRPTRTVLEQPAWKAVYEKDEIRIVDDRGELQETVALCENLTLHHWRGEYFRFEEELDRWKEFRDYQQGMEHKPLLKTNIDPKTTDQRLIKILVRLNDWREFQHYQQVKVGRALMLVWKTTRRMKNIMDQEVASNGPDSNPELQNGLATCFQQLFPRQTGLEASQMQLTWIESQIPGILMEAYVSLEDVFPLQQQFEMKLEQQADALNQELKNLEARPDFLMHSPHQSASLVQRICHWGSEITRLMGEHWEWKIFLKWRNNKPNIQNPAYVGEKESSGCLSDLQIWVDYVSYRRYQLDRTRTWVASWERLQKLREDDLIITSKGPGLFMLEETISSIRASVQKFQQDVRNAEHQVQSAERQLARMSLQRLSPVTLHMTQQSNGRPHLVPSLPDSKLTDNITENSNLVSLSSSPTKVQLTEGSIESPINEILYSIQQSKAPIRGKETQGKWRDLNDEQPVTIADVVVSEQVMVDNVINTIYATDCPYPDEKVGDGGGAGPIGISLSDVEDTSMNDGEDRDNTCSRIASELHSMARSTRVSRNSPLPVHQVPNPRKTPSAIKLTQTISSRVSKRTGKKSTLKAKAFTEQRDVALLRTTLANGSTTDYLLPRRSQRLKEKAAALCRFAIGQTNVAGPSKASRLKKPGEQPKSVKSSPPPRQKKPKVQQSALESPRKSRQRKTKIPINDVGPSLSSRRRRLKA